MITLNIILINMILHLLGYLLYCYNIIISIYFILISLVQFKIFKDDNEIISAFIGILGKMVEPIAKCIRIIIPKIHNIDVPLIFLIVLVEILKNICLK